MYPFLVLGVSHEATDADVERAYRQLVTQFPPDRAPEEFAAVRRAYEQLRTARGRVAARLTYYDATGRSAQTELAAWLERSPRPRLSSAELRDMARRALDDVG